MTIVFTKQNTNYNHDNIKTLIESIPDPIIQHAIYNEKQIVKIHGDIHKSQFLTDNPENYYWLRLSITDEYGMPIIDYSGVHLFLCFRLLKYVKHKYITGPCINPPSLNNTDIADISNLFGVWEFRKITYGVKQFVQEKQTIIKRQKKPLQIIDPKTGKLVSI